VSRVRSSQCQGTHAHVTIISSMKTQNTDKRRQYSQPYKALLYTTSPLTHPPIHPPTCTPTLTHPPIHPPTPAQCQEQVLILPRRKQGAPQQPHLRPQGGFKGRPKHRPGQDGFESLWGNVRVCVCVCWLRL